MRTHSRERVLGAFLCTVSSLFALAGCDRPRGQPLILCPVETATSVGNDGRDVLVGTSLTVYAPPWTFEPQASYRVRSSGERWEGETGSLGQLLDTWSQEGDWAERRGRFRPGRSEWGASEMTRRARKSPFSFHPTQRRGLDYVYDGTPFRVARDAEGWAEMSGVIHSADESRSPIVSLHLVNMTRDLHLEVEPPRLGESFTERIPGNEGDRIFAAIEREDGLAACYLNPCMGAAPEPEPEPTYDGGVPF